MFTGIVSELGLVSRISRSAEITALDISAPQTVAGLRIGDSIAVNGVCLTAVTIDGDIFTVEAMHETLARSSLAQLDEGVPVNLERPMLASGRFDGHIVQGHVDAVGTVVSVAADGAAKRFTFSVPETVTRYIVEKGSITVDGVSLTVTGVTPVAARQQTFEVAVIPHTLVATVFGNYTVGSAVNIEVDVLAKYVERLVEVR
ncbi:Riboflavin synthase eubacterial/eukaryotic [hydrothermal vent metagenome]|uniref:Riboflavin synthase n=1 Tax=hydrothermal vent metagenome TaxID=652676 RepID=A0A3B0SJB2_9ZZZZ